CARDPRLREEPLDQRVKLPGVGLHQRFFKALQEHALLEILAHRWLRPSDGPVPSRDESALRSFVRDVGAGAERSVSNPPGELLRRGYRPLGDASPTSIRCDDEPDLDAGITIIEKRHQPEILIALGVRDGDAERMTGSGVGRELFRDT